MAGKNDDFLSEMADLKFKEAILDHLYPGEMKKARRRLLLGIVFVVIPISIVVWIFFYMIPERERQQDHADNKTQELTWHVEASDDDNFNVLERDIQSFIIGKGIASPERNPVTFGYVDGPKGPARLEVRVKVRSIDLARVDHDEYARELRDVAAKSRKEWAKAAAPTSEKKKTKEGGTEAPIRLTAAELLNRVRQNEVEAAKAYGDRWLEVTGVILFIDTESHIVGGKTIWVSLDGLKLDAGPWGIVKCNFGTDGFPGYAELDAALAGRGKTVTIRGRATGIGRAVVLVGCTMVTSKEELLKGVKTK